MWFEENMDHGLTDDELYDLLKTSGNQIVLLEGPTGCGKSRLIHRMQANGDRKVLTLPKDRFCRALLSEHACSEGEQPFSEMIKDFDLICTEDADLMNGAEYTQKIAAERLSAASKGALVVVNGIRLRERIDALIQGLNGKYRLFEYRDT